MFGYQKPTFMTNFMKINWNGEELYYLEGFFNTISPYSSLYKNMKFRESRYDPMVWSWEVVEPILKTRDSGLSPHKERKKIQNYPIDAPRYPLNQ